MFRGPMWEEILLEDSPKRPQEEESPEAAKDIRKLKSP